jgi:uncharacterized coiled-coil protein SlyX
MRRLVLTVVVCFLLLAWDAQGQLYSPPLTELENRIRKLEWKVDNFESKISALDLQIATLESNVEKAKSKQADTLTLYETVRDLQTKLKKMEKDFTLFYIETKEELKRR